MAEPYKLYTEAGGAVVNLAAGQRIYSIAVDASGSGNVTVAIAAANLEVSQLITVVKGRSWLLDFNGALRGPGSVTFTGLGNYVVTTVEQ